MNHPVFILAFPLLAYLIGAIPFGLLIAKMRGRGDIRNMGSGNIGATNVRRTMGTFWGVVTLLCDASKGLLPTAWVHALLPGSPPWLAPAVALAAIGGHMFPIYLKFKPSGKGVATALGCFAILAPGACGWALIAFVVVVAVTRIVSIASMTAMALLSVLVWFTQADLNLALASTIASVLIVYRHQENIRRLIQGNESSLGK